MNADPSPQPLPCAVARTSEWRGTATRAAPVGAHNRYPSVAGLSLCEQVNIPPNSLVVNTGMFYDSW
jgi:hypothetical protein